MTATVAPTPIELALSKLKEKAARRRVPRDPEWDVAKAVAVLSVFNSGMLVAYHGFMSQFLPSSLPSEACVVFNIAAAAGATQNGVQTFRAARESAISKFDGHKTRQPQMTVEQSLARSALLNGASNGTTALFDVFNFGASHPIWSGLQSFCAAINFNQYRIHRDRDRNGPPPPAA